jgi:hypothetical protein
MKLAAKVIPKVFIFPLLKISSLTLYQAPDECLVADSAKYV